MLFRWSGCIVATGAVLALVACDPSSSRTVPAFSKGDSVALAVPGASLEFEPEQLARALARIPPASRDRLGADSYGRLFDTLVMQELIFAEGIRAGLGQDPVIQQKAASYFRQLVEARVLSDLASTVRISDAEIADYYRANRREFSTRQIRVRQILLSDLAAATKIRQEALDNPEEFSALARQHSIDASSAPDGGDLGFFGYGKMTPEFEDAAFALENPLEVSEIVESPSGFHIIQATAFRPGRERSLDEVRFGIQRRLEQKAADAAREAFFLKLRESVDVEMERAAMEEAFRIAKSRDVPEAIGSGAH